MVCPGHKQSKRLLVRGSVSGSLHRARDCARAEQEIACEGLVSGGVWVNAEQEIACKRSVSESHAEQVVACAQSKKLLMRGRVWPAHRACGGTRGLGHLSLCRARDCLHTEQEIACKRSASGWYAKQEIACTQSKKFLVRGQRQNCMQSKRLLAHRARNCSVGGQCQYCKQSRRLLSCRGRSCSVGGQCQYCKQSRRLLARRARNCLQEVSISIICRAGDCSHTEQEIAHKGSGQSYAEQDGLHAEQEIARERSVSMHACRS